MFETWMRDPEAFSGEYDEYRQLMREQARPERDALDLVREAEENEDVVLEADDLQEWRDPELSEGYEEDCPLDGDAESALASAGFGMDEDYNGGVFPEDPWEFDGGDVWSDE